MSRNFLSVLGLVILAILSLAACGAPAAEPTFPRTESVPDGAGNTGAPQLIDASQDVTAADSARLVIKNASMTIAVDDPTQSAQTIGAMAEEMGGFVVSSNVYQTSLPAGGTVLQASVTVRVPVERLNDSLARIKSETNQPVISENITSEDVTAQYTDLQSRLRNAEAAEEELRKFLDNASDTDDVLNIYAQLKTVREEIEVLKGQIEYYEQSAALSSISVELRANAAVQPITVAGWQPQGIARDAIQALIGALQFLGGVAIWFILFCAPLLIIVGIPLMLLARWGWRGMRKTRKTPLPARQPGPEPPVA